MEEENKVVEEQPVAEAQPVAEEKPAEQPQQANDPNKFSLVTFILACVGFVAAWMWIIGGIAGIILGVMSLKRLPNSNPNKQPFRTFDKVSKPVAIVDIIAGAIMTVVYTIYFILAIVAAVAAAANGAA